MIGWDETNKAAVDAERKLQQHYLDMFDRILPLGYVSALRDPGPGYELLCGFAKLAERLSLATAHTKVAGLITAAAGPQKARCTVAFSRSAPAANAVTIKLGSVVRASDGQRDFVLLEDVAFGIGDAGPHNGVVEAAAADYKWNVSGPVTAPGGTIPGAVDTALTLIQDPPFADATFVAVQVDDATGGQDAALDQLGADRGIARSGSENDASYRLRITSLPDTVSPDAIRRFLHSILDPLGATFELIEMWDPAFQTCWDCPSVAPAGSGLDVDLFVWDDPRPPPPVPSVFRNRWMNGIVGFIVVVPDLSVLDLGMAWNDTAVDPAGHRTGALGTGQRAYSAWDVPSTFTAGAQGAWDGFDVGAPAVYKAIWNGLVAIKAAGVAVSVELEGQ